MRGQEVILLSVEMELANRLGFSLNEVRVSSKQVMLSSERLGFPWSRLGFLFSSMRNCAVGSSGEKATVYDSL